MNIKQKIETYCTSNSSVEPNHLQELNKTTWLNTTNPRMLTGHLQGRFLAMISKMMNPKLVLEIGTFTGYGALCFAEGLSRGGKVISIEINPEHAFKAKEFINKTEYKNNIDVIQMDGLGFLSQFKDKADIIYVDGEKRSYEKYILAGSNALRKGGLLIFDNTLWGGKAIEKADNKDTEMMQEFNKSLQKSEEFETVMLPLRDGLSIARKLV